MGGWLRRAWSKVGDSLWFLPSVLTAAAALLAVLVMVLERHGWLGGGQDAVWVYRGTAEGARIVLSVVAGSLVTVTGVVFSVTIVAVQLASSQYTPRVLRNFSSDRGNQVVLGIFIGTFTYALLVQRTVGNPFNSDDSFVPAISVTIAIVLSLVSVGALIYFINHIAQSIRASVIIARVTDDVVELVDVLFPEQIGKAESAAELVEEVPAHPPQYVLSKKSGYLQGIDEEELFEVECKAKVVIRMEQPMGGFIIVGEPLAAVWVDRAEDFQAVEKKVRSTFVVGHHWTLGQDLERGLIELTDIAVRALSPSLNDPTTAMQCVDRLGEILAMLGSRHPPPTVRTSENGTISFIAKPFTWERAVDAAINHVRHYATRSPDVMARMIEMCGRVRRQVPPHRREILEKEIRDVLEAARLTLEMDRDIEQLEEASRKALAPLVS